LTHNGKVEAESASYHRAAEWSSPRLRSRFKAGRGRRFFVRSSGFASRRRNSPCLAQPMPPKTCPQCHAERCGRGKD